MKTIGIVSILVFVILLGSCYKYDNPLDPDNPDRMTPAPTFNPPGGTYTSHQLVSISCALSGAIIRYTTDGSEPNKSSELYQTPITLLSTTTIKARSFKDGYNPSAIATATYTVNLELLWADHFDNLSEWTNTTNDAYPEAWYIVTDGYIGSGARSDSGSAGHGDTLSRVFTFDQDVLLSIWVNNRGWSWVRLSVKVDGVTFIDSYGNTDWAHEQCIVPSGTHTISINTDGPGQSMGVLIDELEIFGFGLH
jgi:hypothetical protein